MTPWYIRVVETHGDWQIREHLLSGIFYAYNQKTGKTHSGGFLEQAQYYVRRQSFHEVSKVPVGLHR
jgi:hypothetical protein